MRLFGSLMAMFVSGLMQYSVGSDCSTNYLWKTFNSTINCSQAISWNCKNVQNSTNVTSLICNETGLTTIYNASTFLWTSNNVSYGVLADDQCYLDPLTHIGYKSNCINVQQCPSCSGCSTLNVTGSCVAASQTSAGNTVKWGYF